MARQKSTIRFNPLAAAAAAGPMDAASRDFVVPVQHAQAEDVRMEAVPVAAAVDEADAAVLPPADTPRTSSPQAEAQEAEMPEAEPQAPEAVRGPQVSNRRDGMRIVRRYMAFSAAAGILPLPAVDVAGAVAVQVKMLHAIAKLYGVSFDSALARQLVLALVGGGGAIALALPAASAAKTVPVVGTVASVVLSPAFATLSCYGTGRAFLGHFEAGGTLQSFDPGKAGAAGAAA
jgi:hypothetical protein